MFLIGLGFTPRMTCCNPDLGAIVNLIIASRSRHTNSLQENFKKIFLKNMKSLIFRGVFNIFCRKRKASLNPT